MRKLNLLENSKIIGGDQCSRLINRALKMYDKERFDAFDRLFDKIADAGCLE
jgi:hypothetical protein